MSPVSLVVGRRVGSRYVIDEALWDNPGRGRYRGRNLVDAERRVLVSTTGTQTTVLARTSADLALPIDGVAALRAIDVVDSPLPLHGLVEDEPPGSSLAVWRAAGLARAEVIAVAAELADLTARTHARGAALGGLRPELCYAERRGGALVLSGVAPRAIAFFRLGPRLDAGNVPAFDAAFEPTDVALAGRPPTPASDVFTLAATVGFLATGRHPFGDGSWAQQAHAMASQPGGWPDLDDPLLRALEPALAKTAAERPTAAALVARLAALR